MKMFKSLFFVLVLSVVSFLMLSSAVAANQPTVGIQVPAGITAGIPFVVTITAQDAGTTPAFPFTTHVITSLSLSVQGSGWSVSAPASVLCNIKSCTQTFAVNPPSFVSPGASNSVAILTATANSNADEATQQQALVAITSPGTGSTVGHLSVQFSSIPSTVVAGQTFTVTATASDAAGHAITDLLLASSRSNWVVSRTSNACSLSLRSSCTQSFTVAVPSSEPLGATSDLTATASTNVAESAVTGAFRVTVSTVSSGGAILVGGLLPINEATLRVEVDGSLLSEGDTSTIRQLERGETFEVKVSLDAISSVKDVEINAFITGFDSSTEQMTDSVRPFDLGERESTVKRLSLKLPDRADEDRYKLRVVISDRFSEPIVKNYNIKIQPSDTRVVVTAFELSPEDELQAGRAILATVRVKNLGDSSEDDIKIKVSIPELGISATPDFVDELDSDESVTSEEFFLKTGSCAKPGVYDAVAEVTFDDGDEKITSRKSITVTRGVCDAVGSESGQTQVSGKTTIAYSAEGQSAVAGGSAASYPITITNSGTATKAFVLSVDGADWADFKVSPSNLVTVKAGSTQTVYVLASARAGTQSGERVFTVSVKDSSDTVLQTLALKADVVSSSSGAAPSIKSALTIGLVVIVAILVLVGLILAFRRVKGGEEGESQTYY